MKKLIFLVLLSSSLFASLIGNGYIYNDLKVLEELEIDSTFITDYHFQKYYKNFSKNHKDSYTKKLNNAELFVPQIKKILKENNIPSAFLYLVMAESNFVLRAASHKKAMGLWQFIPNTSKVYGLKIDEYVDERMDFVKSTKAAVQYLTRLNKMFDKWYLAAISYNCGEGRVIEGITRATLDMYCKDNNCRKDKTIQKYRKTIRDYQQKKVKFAEINKIYRIVKKWNYKPDIDELLIEQKYIKRQYIPKESRDYIKKIISLAMMNNSEYLMKDENNHLLNRGISSPIATVQVKGGMLLKNIADVIGVSKKELKYLNPHIKRNIIPPEEKKYDIYIPYSQLARFNANIKDIKPNIFEYYIVKSGDSLSKIANIYGVKYKLIKKFNQLKSNLLSINQHLIIPIDPDIYKRPKNYIIKKGDTLIQISKSFKVPLKRIMKDNNIKTSMINIGDNIVIKFK
ncbi:MAG: transglycosylase SLT domain-containing protein [Arcobacteraceae bacterium]|nr:transglycosylase SLT domain-containing protein [Arcobacteraceae bacterium]